MTKDDLKLDEFVAEYGKRIDKERAVLRTLLDKQREKANHILALKASMGITDSYIATVSLSWVAENIKFAADLPLFENSADNESKKIPVNKDTVDLLQQRQPDWRRQLSMSVYLAERDNHKFPPLLVVGYQSWAYKKRHESDKWGVDNRAIEPSIPISPLDSNGFFLDLSNEQTNYYALDGQHRLIAIKGLKDLLNEHRLSPRKEDGTRVNKGEIMLDTIVDSIFKRYQAKNKNVNKQEIRELLENRMHETIGIEIIPAVQMGETQEEATDRLRQIFVDVNEQAKAPSKGDNILLDNTNGFRIVARHIMVHHTLLNNEKTMKKAGQLAEKSPYYTTLPELVQITEKYLKQNLEFEQWGNPIMGDISYGYIRPSEDNIKKGVEAMTAYFDALLKLPSHEHFVQALPENRGKLRTESSPNDDSSAPSAKIRDNILFRPIAQTALADAIGAILAKSETPSDKIQEKLSDLLKIIAKQERKGMLQLRNTKSPWFGVLCDTVDKKMRRHKKYQNLCQRMFFYLLYGMDDNELKDLREEFANARSSESDGNKGWSLEHDEPVKLDEIRLPNPWRE